MSTTDLIRAFALARIGYSAGLIARPARVGSAWIGADAERPAVETALRAVGIRDLALAAGALALAPEGERVRACLLATAASDCADVAATLVAGDAIPRRARVGTVAIAGAAALAGAALRSAAGGDARERPSGVDEALASRSATGPEP
jgi:hypothetical protein